MKQNISVSVDQRLGLVMPLCTVLICLPTQERSHTWEGTLIFKAMRASADAPGMLLRKARHLSAHSVTPG